MAHLMMKRLMLLWAKYKLELMIAVWTKTKTKTKMKKVKYTKRCSDLDR
jgi:hypothetical protein